jgi:hypothetical protein
MSKLLCGVSSGWLFLPAESVHCSRKFSPQSGEEVRHSRHVIPVYFLKLSLPVKGGGISMNVYEHNV